MVKLTPAQRKLLKNLASYVSPDMVTPLWTTRYHRAEMVGNNLVKKGLLMKEKFKGVEVYSITLAGLEWLKMAQK